MNQTNRPDVVVVTGTSAGVGRATARAFAERGAHRIAVEGALRPNQVGHERIESDTSSPYCSCTAWRDAKRP